VSSSSSLVTASLSTCIIPLVGFVSGKHLDCFLWEGRFFEKGSVVILGESGRLGLVKGICGNGKNFIMRRIEEYGLSLDGEVQIQCMVVSALCDRVTAGFGPISLVSLCILK
jgi:hypothetical protein